MIAGNNGPYDHHRGKAPLLRPTAWWRTGAFMAVNLTGFVVVCAFWKYLSTGQWMHFSLSTYTRDLNTPVGQIFVRPLGVLRYPWMILVTGLSLAITVFVPIIVAVLYRLRFAALFVLLVAAVAHAPMLALVTALGCLLAARTYLRSDMPFVASLLGMLPIAGYLYVLGFMGIETVAVMPLQRWVLYAPIVIAIVAAILAAAAVLSLAKVTHFRPGAVSPVLALMLAGPLVAFYLQVGPDELAYSLAARRMAAGGPMFESKLLSQWITENAAEGHSQETLPTCIEDDMKSKGNELAADCREFVARYPSSDRAPEMLWIQAQCLSLQLDRRSYAAGTVKYTSRRSQPAAKEVWRRLATEYDDTSHAALGRWRLGELVARGGKLTEAGKWLDIAAASLVEIVEAREKQRAASGRRTFLPPMTIPADGHYENALFAVQRLVWLMEENNVPQDQKATEALVAYLNADPHMPDYHGTLEALAAKYRQTRLGDNLQLAAARANPDRVAAAKAILKLATDDWKMDAAIEANYQLAQLAFREDLRKHVREIKEPRTYFQAVIDSSPSPWQRLAIKGLALMPSRPGGEP